MGYPKWKLYMIPVLLILEAFVGMWVGLSVGTHKDTVFKANRFFLNKNKEVLCVC